MHDAFVAKLIEKTRALKVGDGREAGVAQGPLIDASAVAKVEELLDDARAKGAEVVLGGSRHQLGGTFFQPTILTGATQEMAFAREEIFGPLAPVFRFETEEGSSPWPMPPSSGWRPMGTSINSKTLKGTEMKTTTYGAVINYLYH